MSNWDEFVVNDFLKVRVIAGEHAIREILLNPASHPGTSRAGTSVLAEAMDQLRAYFERKLFRFQLPLEMGGTEFQRRVWRALEDIPYGKTCSYSDLASAIGSPRAVRAVGAANGRNPIPIVVPCHRVIGAGGKLVGYGGGLDVKRFLLQLEHPSLHL